MSREELHAITAILCEAVPDVVNKEAFLRKHFSKFGEVTTMADWPSLVQHRISILVLSRS